MVIIMQNEKNENLISKLNYKDIIIILGLWYFMATLNFLLGEFNFTILSDLFHYLFILSGRLIFIAIMFFYLSSLYTIKLSNLGINFNNIKNQFLPGLFLLFALSLTVLFFINIPLSINNSNANFNPLYRINSPEILIKSIFPFIIFLIANLIIALSETILIISIIYKVFAYHINLYIATVLSCLFYSIVLIEFTSSQIILNFILAFILIYLYNKTNSIILPTLFLASYYSVYILYIYGWKLLVF
jgi:membrane protease YdiL (CAAX protease family)